MQVDKVAQYQKNLGEVHNWLDSSDDALDGVGEVLLRAKDLVTNAANTGAMTPEDREKIKVELEQLQQQARDLANTKVGEKYIFSGTMTDKPLFNGTDFETGAGFAKDIEIEVFDGVSLRVNTNGTDLFKDIDEAFNTMLAIGDDGEGFSESIATIDGLMDDVLTARADIGARSNRAELMGNRLEMQEGAAKKQRSENEDTEYEKVITEMITQESIHRAALSIGARIIQPSLVDFLR